MHTRKTFCRFCHANCAIEVDIDGDRAVAVRGDVSDPLFGGYTCMKGRELPAQANHPERLRSSQRRLPDGAFAAISSGDALDEIAGRLAAIRDRHGPRAIATYCGTYGFMNSAALPVALGFHHGLGSPSFYTSITIDQPAKVYLGSRVGAWLGGPQPFSRADVSMMIGNNPLTSHYAWQGSVPPFSPSRRLRDAKARGLKLICVDPRRTMVAQLADIHLQVRPGEDATLLAGMLRLILEEELHDREFCEGHVTFPRRCRRFNCRTCGQVLTLVDYLGLLTDATESTSDSAVAMNLKGVLEHLTLLTLLRRLTDSGNGNESGRVLLLKDGPLMLRGQSTRLVPFVRGYLRHLAEANVRVHLAGVDQEGSFVNHATQVDPWLNEAGTGAVFVPDNPYILERIKHAGGASAVYGKRGLYGSKAFCRMDGHTTLVLSVPNRRHDFDDFSHNPAIDDLVGLAPTLGTLAGLISRHFPSTPLPLVAVDRLCDLPHHPYDAMPGGLERLTTSVE